MKRTIPQGQYVAPIHAAESFVGRRYSIDGEYSAHPGDYWYAPDSQPLGMIVRRSVQGVCRDPECPCSMHLRSQSCDRPFRCPCERHRFRDVVERRSNA